MNFKKLYFYIAISSIFLFVLIIGFFLLNFLQNLYIFENIIYLYIVLSIFLLAFFLFLSTKSLNPIFKSEENIKKSIKNTLHELNIPVSTIKINIQMLKKSILDEKNIARVEKIEKANNNLLKLYNNMEYELKKEMQTIDFEEFYLIDAINNSLDKFEDIKKGIKIEVFITKEISLYSDYNGFIIVLDNLISNAIKYNSKENPYIKISFDNSVLSIFNKGLGIDTKNIMLVFDRYFQENSQNIGYGIGLAIVKEFCDKNRIGINIESFEDGNRINLNLKSILSYKKVDL